MSITEFKINVYANTFEIRHYLLNDIRWSYLNLSKYLFRRLNDFCDNYLAKTNIILFWFRANFYPATTVIYHWTTENNIIYLYIHHLMPTIIMYTQFTYNYNELYFWTNFYVNLKHVIYTVGVPWKTHWMRNGTF